jgi:glycosyltransferase involved in cell wall biosynthesis
MKIIGFLQVRNEIGSGHLERFLRINGPLLDAVFVYDDFSDDGTYELAGKHATKVVRGESRQFGHELVNKSLLLSEVKKFGQEGDAVLWLDADEVLYSSRAELEALIAKAFDSGYDGIELPHMNLWRSSDWFRTDDLYDDLRPVRIWRLSNALNFPHKPGLHQQMHPQGIRVVKRLQSPAVVHFGFASTELIIAKHANYRRHWQSGYALHRLISERGRVLQHITTRESQLGSRFRASHPLESLVSEPNLLAPAEWYGLSDRALGEMVNGVQRPKVTVVSLIYASVTWLEFQYAELLRIQKDMPMGDVEILFLANDATPEVLAYLRENDIPFAEVSTRKSPQEWFINSVYRAYNKAVEIAQGEYVLLVNSDMAYAPGALATLMREASPDVFLASRLVELGIMPTGKFGIEKDFGSRPRKYRRQEFAKYAVSIAERASRDGGLYMPLLVNRSRFLEIGGYPEGNLKEGQLSTYLQTGEANYAVQGEPSVPGDLSLIAKANQVGIVHRTVFDSICYHFQAGERRDENRRSSAASGLAVVNDSIVGINGEPVLWGQLSKRLSDLGIRIRTASVGFPSGLAQALSLPARLFVKSQIQLRGGTAPRVVFANATYQIPLNGRWRKVFVRQDSPTTRGYKLLQRVALKIADQVVANDAEYVASTAGSRTQWRLVPLAEIWWPSPTVRTFSAGAATKPKMLFVGAFNETKGWSRMRELIAQTPNVEWTLVSKYADDSPQLESEQLARVRILRTLTAQELKEEYLRADGVVVSSPYETQNLVSLEACSQGTPVLTTPTGFLGSFGLGCHEFGVVTSDLLDGLNELVSNLGIFNPRNFVEKFDLVSEVGWQSWVELLRQELRDSFLTTGEPIYVVKFVSRLRAYGVWLIRKVMRNWIFPVLVKLKRSITSR